MPYPFQYINRQVLSDKDRINSILNKNSSLNFVQRILNPNIFPVQDNQDGSYSTHLMGYSKVGKEYLAYPTIIQRPDTGELHNFGEHQAAIEYALKTGEYIPFGNQEEADWFTQNYKSIWQE
jgi:hypothetical protein